MTQLPKGAEVRLCIRPEHISILRDGDGAGNTVQAKVDNVLYLGAAVQVSLTGPGDTKLMLDVVGADSDPVAVGDIVTIGFDPKNVSVLRRKS